MNNNDYDKLIRSASEKLGSSPEDLRKSLEKKDLSALSAILTKSDKQKLRRVLADKELMKQLKSAGSPEEVMRLLSGVK
jgi:ribosome-binding protein aMBF1 (putative translation factor)